MDLCTLILPVQSSPHRQDVVESGVESDIKGARSFVIGQFF